MKMTKKKTIYVAQFGTGSSVNLLPLAAGQLIARLKQEKGLLQDYNLGEIIFRRPEDIAELVRNLDDVFIIGFSCFLWNMSVSLQMAKEVNKRFPDALIVFGGPSIPKDQELAGDFLKSHPYIDVICIAEEGEEIFAKLCNRQASGTDFSDISGIIYRDRKTGATYRKEQDGVISMESLSSPYLDGTFEDFYRKYKSEFSGIVWETNRGCPFTCAFCTWGNYLSRKVREKPIEQVEGEVEWIGRNQIKYIAFSDANFGIRKRDVDIVKLLVECKKKYGVPNFISGSWVKNSSDKVLLIARMLKEAGIGFRVTLSLQSLNDDVLEAVNRSNIKRSSYEEVKNAYNQEHLFSYTELILGLPRESQDSFLAGLEESLSERIYDQLYVYPCFLFPNTDLASSKKRKEYGIESAIIENRYTKSVYVTKVKEYVEIIVGNSAMPREKWVETFTYVYFTLGIHDDRLAFFILTYLKRTYGIKITELMVYARRIAGEQGLPLLDKSFRRLEDTARGVQERGDSHLIEPHPYGNIPFDPPEGIFLEMLFEKRKFYVEFLSVVEQFLGFRKIDYDANKLKDLFVFQEAIMAHPDGATSEFLDIEYDWIKYFSFAFFLGENSLELKKQRLRVVDPHPSGGKPAVFLTNHFDVRGIPPFVHLYDESGDLVFPPVAM